MRCDAEHEWKSNGWMGGGRSKQGLVEWGGRHSISISGIYSKPKSECSKLKFEMWRLQHARFHGMRTSAKNPERFSAPDHLIILHFYNFLIGLRLPSSNSKVALNLSSWLKQLPSPHDVVKTWKFHDHLSGPMLKENGKSFYIKYYILNNKKG